MNRVTVNFSSLVPYEHVSLFTIGPAYVYVMLIQNLGAPVRQSLIAFVAHACCARQRTRRCKKRPITLLTARRVNRNRIKNGNFSN